MGQNPKREPGAPPAAPHHPFEDRPHRTLLALALPVLISLIAEPITGLVDTGFVAKEGAESLAALGVGTLVLSSSFWIFSFLGVGTQTKVAKGAGRGALGEGRGGQILKASFLASVLCALGVMALGAIFAKEVTALMGGEGEVGELAVRYIRYRLLGAPAVLLTVAAFGAFRGLQDMTTPLWIALGLNGLNVILDVLLIPELGVAGAGLATSISQWGGAIFSVGLIFRRLGLQGQLRLQDVTGLFRIGGDLFVRTGFLSLFLLLGTRAATVAGPEAGAAHQAVRQVWLFSALFLDALAVSGQSLVGYFLGGGWVALAKRVAGAVVAWSFVVGALIGGAMLALTSVVEAAFVPSEAASVFGGAWLIAALSMPINGLTFGTDGIHLGTGDFAWLRNGMLVATPIGALGLWLFSGAGDHALEVIWAVTAGWAGIRAIFGVIRIWPGVGRAPLGGLKGGLKGGGEAG